MGLSHTNNSTIGEIADQVEVAASLSMLDRSMEDMKTGRVRPAKVALRAIADELKLTLNR